MLEPLAIRDEMFAETSTRMGHAWGFGNQLSIFPTRFPPGNSHSKDYDQVQTKVCQVKWETSLYSLQVRKLVNESCGTFVALQNISPSTHQRGELVQLSRQYRCIINACIDDLNQVNKGEEEEADANFNAEVLYKVELVWHLCEVMYLEGCSSAGTGVLPQLMHWAQVHFPMACQNAEKFLLVGSSPLLEHNEDEEFWEVVYGLVVQLHLDSAVQLLRLHPDYADEAYQSAAELLRKMPIYGSAMVNGNSSTPEFTFRWSHWKDECQARIQAGDFYSVPQLELLVRILCGEEEAFDQVGHLFETWYQRMVCELTLRSPTLSAACMAVEAQRFLNSCFQGQGHPEVTSLDNTLLAIFSKDTRKMIGEMQSVLDHCWFSAHLADLLYHAGELHSFEEVNSAALRESLLRDYAVCLFSHPSLWSVGVLYLDSCPNTGQGMLDHLLTRLPYHTSEYKANKILAVIARRTKNENSRSGDGCHSICRVMGRRALASGRLGSAVAWAVKGQDSALATQAADALLNSYVCQSDFRSTDLLDSLGAGLMASDRLAFLGKYREFHRLYRRNEFHAAAGLLISLISSRIAPKSFWTVLLMDALPLLETNPPVFSADQTYELMQSLQELTSSFPASDVTSPAQGQGETEVNHCQLNADKVMLITLALSRNLAKCFVVEQSLCE